MTLREKTQAILDRTVTRNFILCVILFNAIILGLETVEPVMAAAGPLILTLDMICLWIFVAELGAKLFAQRRPPCAAWLRGWSPPYPAWHRCSC